jgi:transcription-repair coupling factor (superfamily II helicase)
MKKELEDRFGALPQQVEDLFITCSLPQTGC